MVAETIKINIWMIHKLEKLRQERASNSLPPIDDLTSYFLAVHFTQKDRQMIAKIKKEEYKKGFQNALTLNK